MVPIASEESDYAWTHNHEKIFVMLTNGMFHLYWIDEMLKNRETGVVTVPFWKQTIFKENREDGFVDRTYEMEFDKNYLVLCKASFAPSSVRRQVQIWTFV